MHKDSKDLLKIIEQEKENPTKRPKIMLNDEVSLYG